MSPREQALSWRCADAQLLGILSLPEPDQSLQRTGVLIVVGGPQYRVGSHRQFVLLARALAEAGYPALRFDYRGMGDSEGEARDFESVSEDIGTAIEALMRAVPGLERVVLWGLCDAASASLLYLHDRQDPRVAGLCLLNPWVRSAQSQAKTRVKHYYRQRLMQAEFWRKLLSGRVAAGAFAELMRALRLSSAGGRARGGETKMPRASFQQRMLAGWQGFEGPVLLILSGADYTAKEFGEYCAAEPGWQAVLGRAALRQALIEQADHTFSNGLSHLQVHRHVLEWLTHNCRGPLARQASAATSD